ncbi:MAG TPA: helix-turn-helix domain-containing GNAT family N-acetyltransferase [Thermoanaerobaculia bacterium]|nr:helix-turn-helix domain-containing GNAT family N-acetyltransferase [Thermoanaerobaculia bacterium]
MTVSDIGLDQQIEEVRRFNRFYTRQIGVLDEGLLASPLSLTEVRVLYELVHRDQPTASEVGKALGLDGGYLSRILRGFQQRGLIDSTPSAADGRQNLLRLTEQGRETFAMLDARARDAVGAMLGRLPAPDRRRLAVAMQTVEGLLDGEPGPPGQREPYLLRPPQAGDMGWIVHRHGVLYAQEYGFDERFEALVAEIVAKFVRDFDPARERCWIAERDGEVIGSICLVKDTEKVAKLRLLLVEPKARGLGLGRRLVAECIRFARQTGYQKITLMTDGELRAARHLYEDAGFRLVHEETHRSWGPDCVIQTWDLEL